MIGLLLVVRIGLALTLWVEPHCPEQRPIPRLAAELTPEQFSPCVEPQCCDVSFGCYAEEPLYSRLKCDGPS